MNRFDEHDVPNEILFHILNYLDAKNLAKAMFVCKDWHAIITSENNLLKEALQSHYIEFFNQKKLSVPQKILSADLPKLENGLKFFNKEKDKLKTKVPPSFFKRIPAIAHDSPNLLYMMFYSIAISVFIITIAYVFAQDKQKVLEIGIPVTSLLPLLYLSKKIYDAYNCVTIALSTDRQQYSDLILRELEEGTFIKDPDSTLDERTPLLGPK